MTRCFPEAWSFAHLAQPLLPTHSKVAQHASYKSGDVARHAKLNSCVPFTQNWKQPRWIRWTSSPSRAVPQQLLHLNWQFSMLSFLQMQASCVCWLTDQPYSFTFFNSPRWRTNTVPENTATKTPLTGQCALRQFEFQILWVKGTQSHLHTPTHTHTVYLVYLGLL